MPGMTTEPTAKERAITGLHRSSALLDAMRLQLWDREGLTVTQLRLLSILDQEGGMSNADLADRLYVTRPSVSALLERLERGGFIRREVSPSDRRGIRIWLEERGHNAVANVRGDFRAYTATLMEDLSDEEIEVLADSFERFVAAGRARRLRDLAAERGEA